MLVHIKTSATCLLITLYMVGFYYRKPHIPIKSTRIFQWLISIAIVNTTFDLITIYTVNRREVIPNFVNLIAHIIYLLSILGFIYLLFVYMRSFLETELKFTKNIKILHTLPFATSTIGIFVLPITYVHGMTTNYSLGPKAYALYVSLVIYLIMILYYCLRYWRIFDKDKRLAIVLAIPLYIMTSFIQILIPETLLVVVCSTLILLGLILSYENMEKYLDEESMLFNQFSFEKVLDEFDFDKQKLIAGVLCLYKTENNSIWKQDVSILNDIYRELKQYHLYGYRIGEDGVAFISNSQEKVEAILNLIKNNIENRYSKETIFIEIKLLPEENVTDKYSCMRGVISFCTEVRSRIAYIDYLTNVYNRNALERDLKKNQRQGKIYYFIADLNDLKLVNDTIGHSAGDILLQDFAHLLVEVVGDDGKVYRQGGDEFSILYEKAANILIENLEKKCLIYNQSSIIPINYAIGYCQLERKEFRDVADRMMYEDKRQKKQISSVEKNIFEIT